MSFPNGIANMNMSLLPGRMVRGPRYKYTHYLKL